MRPRRSVRNGLTILMAANKFASANESVALRIIYADDENYRREANTAEPLSG